MTFKYIFKVLVHPLGSRVRPHLTMMKYLIQWRGIRIRPYRLSTSIFRHYTTQNNEVKPYEDIITEMQTRASQKATYKGPRLRMPEFANHRVSAERYKPLKCGDVVLMNLEPFVVVKTPESPTQNYVIANRVGKAKEVSLGSIDARLLTLLPEVFFTRKDIYAEDDAVTAPLGIIEGDKVREQDLPQPVVRVVNSWLYSIISKPLSDIFEESYTLARQSFAQVESTVRRLQKKDEPVILPFSEFVEQCLQRKMSVVDYYAVAICLDHAALRQTRQLNLSYLGIDAIQLLPESCEKRNAKVLSAFKISDEVKTAFLRDYAFQNLPDGDCESRAIEIMRKDHPDLSYIDHAVTAEILSSEDTFYRKNNWYHWILDSYTKGNNEIASLVNVPVTANDKLSSLRKEYNRPVYCIDELGSHEIDDGISLEQIEDNSVRLGIHIANPTSGFDLKKHLHNILPHCSSVYLHDMTLKLLPEPFTEMFSLSENEAKPVLTLFIDLNLETRELSNVNIEPLRLTNVVCVEPSKFAEKARDDYDLFVEAARILLDRRIKNGMITFKDYMQPELATRELAFQVPGKAITTEFMILANNMAAVYAEQNNIPLLLRNQNILLQSPEIRKQYNGDVAGNDGLMDASWRSVVRRSHVGVNFNKHMGMGVDMATRFTSPLRRLEDLVTHYQIESFLLNDKQMMFSRHQLEQICEQLLLSESIVKEIHRNDAKYASLREITPESQVLGVVLTTGSLHNTKIHLPAYKMDANYTGTRRLDPYSVHNFTVEKVSPLGGYASVY